MIKQNKKRPLISIITPTLNSERFLRENIESLLSQTYPYIEHIIIDGGSIDNTLSIVKELDPKAVVISEPDEGISDAFNKGLGLAKGDIIAILNSDDYYAHNDVVKKVLNIFITKPEVKMVYGRVRIINPETGEALVDYGEVFSLKKMEKEIITPHPSIFARREVYERAGKFSLDYKICMDHEYFLRVTRLYEPYFFDEIVTIMRWGGVSTKNLYLSHREAYRILRSNGIGKLEASVNLVYRYIMTTGSLILQKAGLKSILVYLRKIKGV